MAIYYQYLSLHLVTSELPKDISLLFFYYFGLPASVQFFFNEMMRQRLQLCQAKDTNKVFFQRFSEFSILTYL